MGERRVLIVDDYEDSALMLSEALTLMGCETRTAHDSYTALKVAEEFKPDYAFLDIGLPIIDGYELAARVRAIPGLEHLHLIAVTGYGQDSDKQRSREAGFHDHLVKPLDFTQVLAVLNMRGASR